MKLTRISAIGLKSSAFQTPLEPVTMLTGPNYTGKTSRLDAIRLALIGYLPEIGLRGTSELANGPQIIVTAEMDTGAANTRSWTKNGRGWKTSEQTQFTVPPVLMDSSVYFDLGPKDAMRYVFSLAQLDEQELVNRILSDIKAIRLENHTPDAEKHIRELASEIDASDTARHDSGTPIQEWIASTVENLRGKLRTTKDSIDRMTGMARTLIQFGDDIPARDLSADIALATTCLEDAVKTKTNLQADISKRKSFEHVTQGLDDAQKELEAARQKLAGLKEPTTKAPSPEEVNAKVTEVASKLAAEASKLETVVNLISAHNQELADADKMECCPVCKTPGEVWKKRVIKQIKEDIKTNTKLAESHEAAIRDLAAQRDALKQQFQDACTAQSAADLVKQDRNVLQSTITRLEAFLGKSASAIEALKAMPAADVLESLFTQSDSDVVKCRERLEKLRTSQAAYNRHQQDVKRDAQAQQELESCRLKHDCIKAVIGVIETIQADVSAQVLDGLCKRANEVTKGIITGELMVNDGELCLVRDGHIIPHRTFSGTEKALAYAALSVALAQSSPIKLVLLDEMGRMDNEHRRDTLLRMLELVKAGKIDQFIGVDTTKEPYVRLDGVTVVGV